MTSITVVSAESKKGVRGRRTRLVPGDAVPSARELLGRTPYFADLSLPELADMERALVRRRYRKGELVLLEGRPSQGLYVVESGRVRIYKTSLQGREQVLLLAGPGETFNEVAVFDGGPNPATVQALEPTVLLLLPKAALLALIERQPAVGRAFTRVFAAHLRRLTDLVEDLSFKTVTSRVARILLEHLAPSGAVSAGDASATPRLTQSEMAAMAGTAREVVGRALKALEQRRVIQVERGRIVVLDPDLLAEIAR